MSVLIQTTEVPAADRLELVRSQLAALWVPMVCHSPCADDFRGTMRASGIGPLQVVVADGPPITVQRTPSLIEEADPDLVKLVLVRGTGNAVVAQSGRQARLTSGEFAVYDTRRPYEVSCGVDGRAMHIMTFMFEPSLLPLTRSWRKELSAVRFPATAGLGDVTSQLLLQVARNVDDYTPLEAARLSAAALEVLATRLARELDSEDWGTPESRRHALLTTVQAFIAGHLGDPSLNPQSIAAAHHISLRSLHQLFKDHGLSVAAWIRQRRLEACRRDLADPAFADQSVAAIAARRGFASASDFSRSFRAMHGLPPAEYRRSARDRSTSAP